MKFSITIPAYKAKFLKECIESILSQTLEDFEIVIVDDSSPEDLVSIVNMFVDQRIRYYRNEKNCGAIDVVDNWNKCLAHAKGEWIICMGDDDRLLPNCLEDYCSMIEKYPSCSVFHAWTEIINEKSEVIQIQEPRPEIESVYSMIWGRMHGRKQFIGDFLFKTDFLKDMGGFYKLPLAWGSDDITAYIAAEKSGIVNSQIPLFQYRDSAITLTSSNNNADYKFEGIKKYKTWMDEFLKQKPNNLHDKVLYDDIIRFKQNFFENQFSTIISQDLAYNSLFRWSYWKKRGSELGFDRHCRYKIIKDAFVLKMRNILR